jgi:RNA polymerase sigma-70 factor, ECF subfamily
MHQPWWATRAYLLAAAGEAGKAAEAYIQALALTGDPALRRYLAARLEVMRARLH